MGRQPFNEPVKRRAPFTVANKEPVQISRKPKPVMVFNTKHVAATFVFLISLFILDLLVVKWKISKSEEPFACNIWNTPVRWFWLLLLGFQIVSISSMIAPSENPKTLHSLPAMLQLSISFYMFLVPINEPYGQLSRNLLNINFICTILTLVLIIFALRTIPMADIQRQRIFVNAWFSLIGTTCSFVNGMVVYDEHYAVFFRFLDFFVRLMLPLAFVDIMYHVVVPQTTYNYRKGQKRGILYPFDSFLYQDYARSIVNVHGFVRIAIGIPFLSLLLIPYSLCLTLSLSANAQPLSDYLLTLDETCLANAGIVDPFLGTATIMLLTFYGTLAIKRELVDHWWGYYSAPIMLCMMFVAAYISFFYWFLNPAFLNVIQAGSPQFLIDACTGASRFVYGLI